MAQLLDQLHVDVREEPQSNEDNAAQEVPVEPPSAAAAAIAPQLVERLEEQQESAAANGGCSLPAPEPTDFPGPPVGSQEGVQPPDITSTVGQSQPGMAAMGGQEQRPADILDQVPFTDRSADSDSGPCKPPRQFTVEPDIVASTKKPPPSRPPPPSGGPPPRPPPPSWQSLPSRKSQDCLRPSGLEGKEKGSMNHIQTSHSSTVCLETLSLSCVF